MRQLGLLWLLFCWLVWLAPFVLRSMRQSKRKSMVTASASRWGMALQSIGYVIVWTFRGSAVSGPRVIASMLAGFLGALLGIWSVRKLGKQWRIQAGLYADHELIQSGPYAVVRHPIYFSMLLMLLAAGFLFTPWHMLLIALAFCIAGTEIRVRIEERLLQSRFGPTLDAYRRRVPAYLPPIR